MTKPHSLFLPAMLGLALPCCLVQAAALPESGQLLQQVQPPAAAPAPSNPGLKVEQPEAAPLRAGAAFAVRRIIIEGNTLLTSSQLHALVASAEGSSLTLADLDALAQRITQAYQQAGFELSRAYVPAQTVADGVVRIKVIEARYGKIDLTNSSSVSDRPLTSTLAALRPGQVITQGPLDRTLLLLNDIPGVVVNSTLRPGARPGTSDLLVHASPGAPYAGSASLDNNGSAYTGRARLSANLALNSPLHLGDTLTVSALTSGDDLKYGRADAQFLLGGAGTRFGLAVSDLGYHLNPALNPLGANGTAEVSSVDLTQPLIRSLGADLSLRAEFDHKKLHDDIDASSTFNDRDINVWTATLNGDQRDAWGHTQYSATLALGRLRFANATAQADDARTADTAGSYSRLALALTRLQQFGTADALNVALSGQAATTNLDSSEQFMLGGPASVRAYDSGAASGSQGVLLQTEWRHLLPQQWQGAWQSMAFVDSGHVQVYRTAFTGSGVNDATLTGAGVGLSWSGPQGWSANATLAARIGASPALVGPSARCRFWMLLQKAF
jgi:hemolysin activation/secretion protein